ncbi:stage V sporulation protein E [Clostridium intestinale]|uniref:Probable peptidoglycan glycosyltransferase FtsW n=1 Tax=Clostridium intestinale DSM 6191 TaxID=1121320 RepID=A0A1M5Z0G4_9CLOT|nr:stage V sporulation protein E [Clostridium intestinale]SHI17757.1 cell division protein FtsW [Clostridium intestinale DSM 6191]
MKKFNSKLKMGQIDYPLFYVVFFILAIGVVMVYSASTYYGMYVIPAHDSMYFLKRQILFAALGIIAMLFMMAFDYHKLKKLTLLILIVTVILLIAVFFFEAKKGAQRWISIGPFSLQPSEIAKYAVVLFLALSLEQKGEKVKGLMYGMMPYLGFSGFFAGMVLLQKNLSIASVIMIVTLIVLFVSGARLKDFAVILPVLFAGAVFFIFSEEYRKARLLNFINPWNDPAGNGYQLIQSFLALGSGGITGLGLGQSRQKTLYMPEPHNDFIFSIIGEELGLIGCLFIIALFGILIWRGITIAIKAKDTYGTLLAVGITSVIAVQAIINIAVVTGSMPVTGVPLPFISYGGSALVINMTAMGILLNISRQTEKSEVF